MAGKERSSAKAWPIVAARLQFRGQAGLHHVLEQPQVVGVLAGGTKSRRRDHVRGRVELATPDSASLSTLIVCVCVERLPR